jgi:hypothetical protein
MVKMTHLTYIIHFDQVKFFSSIDKGQEIQNASHAIAQTSSTLVGDY